MLYKLYGIIFYWPFPQSLYITSIKATYRDVLHQCLVLNVNIQLIIEQFKIVKICRGIANTREFSIVNAH